MRHVRAGGFEIVADRDHQIGQVFLLFASKRSIPTMRGSVFERVHRCTDEAGENFPTSSKKVVGSRLLPRLPRRRPGSSVPTTTSFATKPVTNAPLVRQLPKPAG